jgi:hypothetical protein
MQGTKTETNPLEDNTETTDRTPERQRRQRAGSWLARHKDKVAGGALALSLMGAPEGSTVDKVTDSVPHAKGIDNMVDTAAPRLVDAVVPDGIEKIVVDFATPDADIPPPVRQGGEVIERGQQIREGGHDLDLGTVANHTPAQVPDGGPEVPPNA